MRISVETTGGLGRKLNVAVPAESFESQVQERLKDTAKQVRLPGFRPGRVPMKEVRRRFGTKVRADVAGEVIDRSFTDAVTQEDLAPVGQPRVDIINFAPGADFEYSATFEVLPTFQVAGLAEMEVVRLEAEVTEADIDSMVENLRERATIWEEVERPSVDGDRVTYRALAPKELRKADDEGDGWTTERDFVLGADAMPFGDALRGLSAGERISRPLSELVEDAAIRSDDAEADDDSVKKAIWTLELTRVKEGRLPDMDAEFFTTYGVEDGTEESFRAHVLQNMQARLDEAMRQHLRNSVFNALRAAHGFALPKPLVDDTVRAQQDRYRSMGTDPERVPLEALTKSAEAIVRTQLVVRRIIEEENLTVDPTRLRERIDQYASSFDDSDALVQYIYSEDRQLDRFEAQVLEAQVVEHVAARAHSRTEQCSYMEALRRASDGDAPPTDDQHHHHHDHASGEDHGEAESAPPESGSDESR